MEHRRFRDLKVPDMPSLVEVNGIIKSLKDAEPCTETAPKPPISLPTLLSSSHESTRITAPPTPPLPPPSFLGKFLNLTGIPDLCGGWVRKIYLAGTAVDDGGNGGNGGVDVSMAWELYWRAVRALDDRRARTGKNEDGYGGVDMDFQQLPTITNISLHPTLPLFAFSTSLQTIHLYDTSTNLPSKYFLSPAPLHPPTPSPSHPLTPKQQHSKVYPVITSLAFSANGKLAVGLSTGVVDLWTLELTRPDQLLHDIQEQRRLDDEEGEISFHNGHGGLSGKRTKIGLFEDHGPVKYRLRRGDGSPRTFRGAGGEMVLYSPATWSEGSLSAASTPSSKGSPITSMKLLSSLFPASWEVTSPSPLQSLNMSPDGSVSSPPHQQQRKLLPAKKSPTLPPAPNLARCVQVNMLSTAAPQLSQGFLPIEIFGKVTCLEWSPSGKNLAVGTEKAGVWIYNPVLKSCRCITGAGGGGGGSREWGEKVRVLKWSRWKSGEEGEVVGMGDEITHLVAVMEIPIEGRKKKIGSESRERVVYFRTRETVLAVNLKGREIVIGGAREEEVNRHGGGRKGSLSAVGGGGGVDRCGEWWKVKIVDWVFDFLGGGVESLAVKGKLQGKDCRWTSLNDKPRQQSYNPITNLVIAPPYTGGGYGFPTYPPQSISDPYAEAIDPIILLSRKGIPEIHAYRIINSPSPASTESLTPQTKWFSRGQRKRSIYSGTGGKGGDVAEDADEWLKLYFPHRRRDMSRWVYGLLMIWLYPFVIIEAVLDVLIGMVMAKIAAVKGWGGGDGDGSQRGFGGGVVAVEKLAKVEVGFVETGRGRGYGGEVKALEMDMEGRRVIASFVHRKVEGEGEGWGLEDESSCLEIRSTVLFDARGVYTYIPPSSSPLDTAEAEIAHPILTFLRPSEGDIFLPPIGVVDIPFPDEDEHDGGRFQVRQGQKTPQYMVNRSLSSTYASVDRLIGLYGIAHTRDVLLKGTLMEGFLDGVVRRRRRLEDAGRGKGVGRGQQYKEVGGGENVVREGVVGVLGWVHGGVVVSVGVGGRGVGFLYGAWRQGTTLRR